VALHAYKARDAEGRLERGCAEADGAAQLRESLRARGLYLVEAKPLAAAGRGRGCARASREELILFSFHLQTVIGSGIPLLVGLGDLADQTPNRRFRAVVEDVRDAIRQGATLRQALGRHPGVFSASYVNMVEAGEASGRLDEILGRLVRLLEWSAELRSQIRQLLTYPAIVSAAMAGLVVLMLTYVLPRFSEVLESLNVALPWPTRVLLGASQLFRQWWPLLAGGAAALLLLGVALSRHGASRERLDRLALRLPAAGELVRAFVGSQIAHFLGAFTEAGVPIAQGLPLLAGVVSNRHVARRLEEVRRRVLAGGTLTEAFGDAAILPPLVFRMVAIGEETGQLPQALRKAEEFYDRELPRRVKRLTDLMAPAITVVMGAVLLFVLASVLLPLYRAYSAISGGAA